MRVKLKNEEKWYFLVDFSSQTMYCNDIDFQLQQEVRPVAILRAKDGKTLRVVEISEIEEVD
jgi:hypothetical protein